LAVFRLAMTADKAGKTCQLADPILILKEETSP
jgi:hypothetical protein